jgi:hypothetical protein
MCMTKFKKLYKEYGKKVDEIELKLEKEYPIMFGKLDEEERAKWLEKVLNEQVRSEKNGSSTN